MKKRYLSTRQREILRTPAGWCRGVVLDSADGLFYPEQEADMNLPDNVLFYAKRKSRRCGWSHGLTRESVAEAHLIPDLSIYFVSMSLENAYKKIEECLRFYHGVHPAAQRPLVEKNRMMLRFSHGKGRYSEIIATFRARGMPGRNIYIKIDEADHIPDLKGTIQDSAPNVIQGKSRMKIGGTVNRDSGPFWDFFNMDFEKLFPGDEKMKKLLARAFRKAECFWWDVPWLLNPEARLNRFEVKKLAPHMTTQERVMEFGSDRLRITFAMFPLEDFQQEFELKAIKSGAAVIPWEQILAVSSDPKHHFLATTKAVAKYAQDTGSALFAGYDVGRTDNASELTIFGYQERSDFATEIYKERHHNVPLPEQTRRLRRLLQDELTTLKIGIDMNGLGREMAETLEEEFPGRAIPVSTEHYRRSGIIDEYASRISHSKIKLVPDPDRRQQIHSIKRKQTEAGRTVYYVHRKEKHHADVAISQALGIHAINANSMHADFNIAAGGSNVDEGHIELNELCGGHEDFMRDVINA